MLAEKMLVLDALGRGEDMGLVHGAVVRGDLLPVLRVGLAAGGPAGDGAGELLRLAGGPEAELLPGNGGGQDLADSVIFDPLQLKPPRAAAFLTIIQMSAG